MSALPCSPLTVPIPSKDRPLCLACRKVRPRGGRALCKRCRWSPQVARRYGVVIRCQHCGKQNVNRARELCWSCYHKPAVRRKYSAPGPSSRCGLGLNVTEPLPPPQPTAVLPGKAKVAVLMERAAKGQSLWHPHDVRLEAAATDEAVRRLALRG